MSELITRRKLITSGVAVAAGIAGLGTAARIADKYGFLAPDHNGILGAGAPLACGAALAAF